MAVTSRSASLTEGDRMGGCNSCSSLSATKSGICSSLILVGVDDADEHGIPGVNAGHLQVSDQHCVHTSFSMFSDILISLKAASRSKLAQRLCISLLYWIPVLYFVVGPGMKCLLAAGVPSVRLIVPGSGVRCISRSHGYIVVLSLQQFTTSVWAVVPRA